MVGWTQGPDGRGTADILWTCFLTIFACTYSIIHVNLPAEDESGWGVLVRKVRWSLWAVYAPELVTAHAATQWEGARKSRDEMRGLGVANWDLVHGFFALSGGFVLHPPDTASFPVNAKALFYLVSRGHVPAPKITAKEIWDRSKRDRFAKTVAVLQSLYLVTQTLGRAFKSLQVTCLELVTVAFLLCTAVTSYFWMMKALDVETPEHIYMKTSMARVLIEAGPAANEPFFFTPMDFVEQPGWFKWKRQHIFRDFGGIGQRPLRRIPNDFYDGPASWKLAIFLWVASIAHLGVHVFGWAFFFPTVTEWYMWQVASLSLLAIISGSGLFNVFSVKPGLDFRVNTLGIWYTTPEKNTFWRRWAVHGPAFLAAMVYYLAKTFILVEAFVSLRLMSTSAYQTVPWTDYLLRGS